MAVAPVILGDVAAPIERTGECGLTLHAPPAGGQEDRRNREVERGAQRKGGMRAALERE